MRGLWFCLAVLQRKDRAARREGHGSDGHTTTVIAGMCVVLLLDLMARHRERVRGYGWVCLCVVLHGCSLRYRAA